MTLPRPSVTSCVSDSVDVSVRPGGNVPLSNVTVVDDKCRPVVFFFERTRQV